MAQSKVGTGNGNGRELSGTSRSRPFPNREQAGTSLFRDVPDRSREGGGSRPWDNGINSNLIAAPLAPLDRIVRQLESAWGPGRIETLIDPALAGKVALAREQLDDAITANDPEAVAHYASAMARGWQAIESAALAAGHTPADTGRVWFVEAGDRRFALVQDETDVGVVQKQYPDHSVWSCREVARVLAAKDLTTVLAAKAAFPGATVTKVTRDIDWQRGDAVADIGVTA